MRHRVAGRRLGRDSEHRVAMRRNMVSSLFEHETISTTIQKAKEVKPFAEKLITLARKGDLAARRRAISLLGNRNIVEQKDGEYVKTSTVIHKLFSEIGPRYLERPGGYTRIIKLAKRRLGDNGELCLLQLVGKEMAKKKKKSTKSKAAAKKPIEQAEVVEEAAVAQEETIEEVQDAVEPAVESEDAPQEPTPEAEEEKS